MGKPLSYGHSYRTEPTVRKPLAAGGGIEDAHTNELCFEQRNRWKWPQLRAIWGVLLGVSGRNGLGHRQGDYSGCRSDIRVDLMFTRG